MSDNVLAFPDRKSPERDPHLPDRRQLLRRAVELTERAAVCSTLATHIAPGDPLAEATQLLRRAREVLLAADPAWLPFAEQADGPAESRVWNGRGAPVADPEPVLSARGPSGRPTFTPDGAA